MGYTMVIKKSERRSAVIKHMRDGEGSIRKFDYEPIQVPSHTKMIAEIRVEPGCSIGIHIHQNEHEIFFCHEGELTLYDNGTECVLHPGDVSICLDGESHGIANHTNSSASLYAVIITH